MKKIGETKNFYVYTITSDDDKSGGILDGFLYDDSDEYLNQFIAAVKSAEGRKALYNEWMYDGYEEDKLRAKDDPWIADQLKCASRPLYFVVAKEDSDILTYENGYLVPAVIGDVENAAWGSGSFLYEEDRYDITRTLFGKDHDAVWDIINRWIDGGSTDLDVDPEKVASSPQDTEQASKLLDNTDTYELRWMDGGREESITFNSFNDAVAIFAAAEGGYSAGYDGVEYDPEELLYFYDESGEIDAGMCKKKASEEFPARGVTYLKNKTTGKVLYSRSLAESRRRLHRSLRESRRSYRRRCGR